MLWTHEWMNGKPTGLSSVSSSDLRFRVKFLKFFFLNHFSVQKQSTEASCEKAMLKNFAKFQENDSHFFTELLLIGLNRCHSLLAHKQTHNHITKLASFANWLSIRLQGKRLCIRILMQSSRETNRQLTEVVARRSSSKKMFFKISQNSQENICARRIWHRYLSRDIKIWISTPKTLLNVYDKRKL